MVHAGAPKSLSISPALHGLLGALLHAHPSPLSRARLCQTLGTSREALRQNIHRLDLQLGKDSLLSNGDEIRLSAQAAELARTVRLPIEVDEPQPRPEDSALAVSFRTTVLEMATVNKDDARAMLVSNSWMTRVLRTADFGRLLEATRPESSDRPFAGERRNMETLLMMGQGAHREAVLHGLARAKKGARRRGQWPVYSNAVNLERFVFAGDYDLPLTPVLSRIQLQALPFYERLAYLSNLYLDARETEVVQATEWVAAGLDTESEASRLHFWGNATVLSVFAAGCDLAAQARAEAEGSPMFRLDRNTQRCLHISVARELLWQRRPEEAMSHAQSYREISDSMGWSNWDYHEIGAKAGLLKGDLEGVERHRNELHDQLARRGYLAKRFVGKMFEGIDAANPRHSKRRSVTPVVTASSIR